MTRLPDGRVVFIYNDVVVWHPDGALDIFGCPLDVLPPTDFHTAGMAVAPRWLGRRQRSSETGTSPGEFDARNRGLEIDIDVTPAPGALVLGGSVKHTVLEGFGWMPGEAFLPVVDSENTLLNDNKVLQPQFTTRDSPFLAAATAGQPCQIPINTSFGQTILELTCTPFE